MVRVFRNVFSAETSRREAKSKWDNRDSLGGVVTMGSESDLCNRGCDQNNTEDMRAEVMAMNGFCCLSFRSRAPLGTQSSFLKHVY